MTHPATVPCETPAQRPASGRSFLEKLLERAVLSPTSFNLQHWRFVIIDDRAQLQLIRAGAANEAGRGLPAALILVCARISVWQDVLRYNRHLTPQGIERVSRNCRLIYDGFERVQRDEACRSAGLVTANMMDLLLGAGAAFEYIETVAAPGLPWANGLEGERFMACAIAMEETRGAARTERGPLGGSVHLMRDTFSASAQECLPAELAIGKRRAIKHFDSSYRIPSEVFARIVAGISVLAGRVDLGRVVIVDVRDAGIRQGIARVGFAQPQYTEASRILVLCYDLGAAADTLSGPQYNRRRDAAMIRAGLVAQRLMISAAQLGVDSCPMIGFDYQEVGRLLRKPGECLVLMIVALGRRREDPPPRPPRLDVKDIVTYNGLS